MGWRERRGVRHDWAVPASASSSVGPEAGVLADLCSLRTSPVAFVLVASSPCLLASRGPVRAWEAVFGDGASTGLELVKTGVHRWTQLPGNCGALGER